MTSLNSSLLRDFELINDNDRDVSETTLPATQLHRRRRRTGGEDSNQGTSQQESTTEHDLAIALSLAQEECAFAAESKGRELSSETHSSTNNNPDHVRDVHRLPSMLAARSSQPRLLTPELAPQRAEGNHNTTRAAPPRDLPRRRRPAGTSVHSGHNDVSSPPPAVANHLPPPGEDTLTFRTRNPPTYDRLQDAINNNNDDNATPSHYSSNMIIFRSAFSAFRVVPLYLFLRWTYLSIHNIVVNRIGLPTMPAARRFLLFLDRTSRMVGYFVEVELSAITLHPLLLPVTVLFFFCVCTFCTTLRLSAALACTATILFWCLL